MIDEALRTPVWRAMMSDADWGPARPALSGRTSADVAIVGGGYSGLWTAHHLVDLDPTLRIVVLEADEVGHGASGRNGGWCSAEMPMSLTTVADRHGPAAAVALQRALDDTVDAIGRTVHAESIACDFTKGGSLTLLRSRMQVERAHEHLSAMRRLGIDEGQLELLDASAALERCSATRVLGAVHAPNVAALQPARLVRGLAALFERRGVVIHERSRVTDISERSVRTQEGSVDARVVVRATEAFTALDRRQRRRLTPIHSLMIATEPLSDAAWAEIGLHGRPTFNDLRHLVIYGQRTADGRIAFGGRGARYRWGSNLDPRHSLHLPTHQLLERTLLDLFPVLDGVRVTHRWGGAVAAPRDWWCHVDFDRSTGSASIGGYVGEGVAASHLAGRALAHLVTGIDDPVTSLPFVGHRSPRWEPEPFRWIGVNALIAVTAATDRAEERHGRRSRWREALIGAVMSDAVNPGTWWARRRRRARS